MKKIHKIIIIFTILFSIVFLLFPKIIHKNGDDTDYGDITSVIINDTEFLVDVAYAPQERKNGLSGKESLPLDNGMLFVFEKSGIYPFWMKDMNFPIDIIWISVEPSDKSGEDDKKVVYIKENATPESFPDIFTPDTKAIYVLEVNAGVAKEKKIKIGDEVILNVSKSKQ